MAELERQRRLFEVNEVGI